MRYVRNRLVAGSSLSRAGILAVVFGAAVALATPEAYAQSPRRAAGQINVLPITINNVVVQDGALVALGSVGAEPFTAPILVDTEQANGECPILNLSLGPITLNLLGLQVKTSAICLDVTANQGEGLLGDLLCTIANLLEGGALLEDVLAGLNTDELTRLNLGLTSLLNQAVFIPLSSSSALVDATCEVLNLELGPVDLNLLGLRVELDNCAGGPVTLDITAIAGGGLLGNLLCGLANLLDSPAPNPAGVLELLRQIAPILGRLI